MVDAFALIRSDIVINGTDAAIPTDLIGSSFDASTGSYFVRGVLNFDAFATGTGSRNWEMWFSGSGEVSNAQVVTRAWAGNTDVSFTEGPTGSMVQLTAEHTNASSTVRIQFNIVFDVITAGTVGFFLASDCALIGTANITTTSCVSPIFIEITRIGDIGETKSGNWVAN